MLLITKEAPNFGELRKGEVRGIRWRRCSCDFLARLLLGGVRFYVVGPDDQVRGFAAERLGELADRGLASDPRFLRTFC
jgi:hypothetical protein